MGKTRVVRTSAHHSTDHHEMDSRNESEQQRAAAAAVGANNCTDHEWNEVAEVRSRFNRLIGALVAAHDKFDMADQQFADSQLDAANDDDDDESDRRHTSETTTSASCDNELKQTRSLLFDKFMHTFDELSMLVVTAKRETTTNTSSSNKYAAMFDANNLHVIKLYELLARLLSVQIRNTSSVVRQCVIVDRSLEFLHLLTTSEIDSSEDENHYNKQTNVFNLLLLLTIVDQNRGESDEDELTLVCCEQLTQSYNIVSSICSIIYGYLKCGESGGASGAAAAAAAKRPRHSLLTHSNVRLAFSVLIKLTADNAPATIDLALQQLTNCLIEKMYAYTCHYTQLFHRYPSQLCLFVGKVWTRRSSPCTCNSWPTFCAQPPPRT